MPADDTPLTRMKRHMSRLIADGFCDNQLVWRRGYAPMDCKLSGHDKRSDIRMWRDLSVHNVDGVRFYWLETLTHERISLVWECGRITLTRIKQPGGGSRFRAKWTLGATDEALVDAYLRDLL